MLTDKYRPRTLQEVVGNTKAIKSLWAFSKNPRPEAFLLKGAPGIGKTSAALALANDLKIGPMDVQDYSGQEIGEREVEEIFRTLRHYPFESKWRIVIINEADKMTMAAQVLCMQYLEKLPKHGIVVMTSNDADAFEPRFLSRLTVIHFTTQGLKQVAQDLLGRICELEGATIDPKVIARLVEASRNNIRTALKGISLEILEAAGEGFTLG